MIDFYASIELCVGNFLYDEFVYEYITYIYGFWLLRYNNSMKNTKRGFAGIGLIIIILAVLATGTYVYTSPKYKNSSETLPTESETNSTDNSQNTSINPFKISNYNAQTETATNLVSKTLDKPNANDTVVDAINPKANIDCPNGILRNTLNGIQCDVSDQEVNYPTVSYIGSGYYSYSFSYPKAWGEAKMVDVGNRSHGVFPYGSIKNYDSGFSFEAGTYTDSKTGLNLGIKDIVENIKNLSGINNFKQKDIVVDSRSGIQIEYTYNNSDFIEAYISVDNKGNIFIAKSIKSAVVGGAFDRIISSLKFK